jgi:hypothetical protein
MPKLSNEEMAKIRAAAGNLRFSKNLGIRPGEREVLENITHYELRTHNMVATSFSSAEEAFKVRDEERAKGVRCAVYAAGLLPSRGPDVTGIAGPIEELSDMITKKGRFSYGTRIALVFERDKKVIRTAGVVISNKPLVASVQGSQLAFDQTGKVLTAGFPEGARVEEALPSDN